jgi:hypothetical protein
VSNGELKGNGLKNTPTTTTKQNPNHNPTQKTNPQQTPQKNTHTKKPTTTTKQKTHKKQRSASPKQFAPFSTNSTGFSSIGQNSLNNYFSLNQACRWCLNNILYKLYLTKHS